jgi:hypothetical protein
MNFGTLKDLLSTLLEDTSTDLWTAAERASAINSAYIELYSRAASLGGGQGLEVKEGTLTVVAGTATVTLPSDILYPYIIDISYKESETRSWPWIPTSPSRQHIDRSAISRGSHQLSYYVRGSSIVLVPTPDWSSSTHVKILYVYEPTTLSADANTPLLPPQHHELIAYYAFERLLQKEGTSMLPGAATTKGRLERAFDRDMQSRHKSDSRRLNGSEVEF